jgi:hypothetical protein
VRCPEIGSAPRTVVKDSSTSASAR